MQPDEVDYVAPCLAAEACETLPVNVDKEARSPIGMEWTQTLPAMRTGPLQSYSSSLDHIQEPIGQLDLGNIPAPTSCWGSHDRPASAPAARSSR